MDHDATTPRTVSGTPVRTLRVVVASGPDAGRDLQTDQELVTIGTANGNDVQLTDRSVSRYHLELVRKGARIVVRDLGSTNGTSIGAAMLEGSQATIAPGTEVALGATTIRIDDGELRMVPVATVRESGPIRGRSLAMRRIATVVEELAQKDAAVMILGESGVGKEVVARALHDLGPRAAEPFVTVDCGSIPAQLFASEIFGHEKGAFTGAERQHKGAFERAADGTLFLDELGELSLEHQAAILGVLERRRFKRVGGSVDIPVDVRIVAATHRDLRAAVNAGRFRLDLYYRLAVVLVHIPPLRERPEDLPALIEHFLREAGVEGTAESLFGADVMASLEHHSWPGNVRELRNVVEATLAIGRAPMLESLDIKKTGGDLVGAVLDRNYRDARATVLEDFERRYLTALLARAKGSIREAARIGTVDRSHLMDLLRRNGMR
jgi:DNA-binding NtrC family response regulator